MDQLESPGISPPLDPPRRRFSRLLKAPASVRRLAPHRLAMAVLLAIAVAGLFLLGVSRSSKLLKSYVDNQRAYQLSYSEIVLDPPPPPWFRGKSAAFLKNALGEAEEYQSFSALDFDRERLLIRFRRYPWVKRGLRVEVKHPNSVIVRLEYRVPVAVKLENMRLKNVVDEEGVILPTDDIDPTFKERLVRLALFPGPVDPEPGQFWSRFDEKQGVPVRDERIAAAAGLAEFFRRRLSQETAGTADRFPRLYILHHLDPTGVPEIHVQAGPSLVFFWSREGAPEAKPEWLSPEAQWIQLRDYVRRHPPRDGDPASHLIFGKDGVEEVKPGPVSLESTQVGKTSGRRSYK